MRKILQISLFFALANCLLLGSSQSQTISAFIAGNIEPTGQLHEHQAESRTKFSFPSIVPAVSLEPDVIVVPDEEYNYKSFEYDSKRIVSGYFKISILGKRKTTFKYYLYDITGKLLKGSELLPENNNSIYLSLE
ncbi:MAG: hypothetical protein C0594_14315 [Marinilabiliales bacterium]|nr:MAG: hypothetical protein C0594_14315 [Marinilabiliales bacterium]